MLMDKLKKIRKEKKMTQTMLAELCGISRNSIVNWETGKSTPKVADIEKLSIILGISPHELMEGSRDVSDDVTSKRVDDPSRRFAYWGGVVDEARRVAERGDAEEMSYIEPLLRLAYKMLQVGISKIMNGRAEVSQPNVLAYNGNHSNYMSNNLMVNSSM